MTVDTHVHLTMDDYNHDREAVLKRAWDHGVHFIEIGVDEVSSKKACLFAERLGAKCSLGIHPHYAGAVSGGLEGAWKSLKSYLEARRQSVVAIGEIGLDFARDLSPRSVQVECFEMGLALAKELGLPAIVHQRDAEKEVVALVKSAGLTHPPVFHCFTGDRNSLRRLLDVGGYLGVGGFLTYKKNETLRDAVKYVPMDRLLLETDSPYLAPGMHRGKRNEPFFVLEVRDRVAQLLGLSDETVSLATTANVSGLFFGGGEIGLGEELCKSEG